MSVPFPEIKKNFGFGVMRLPVTDGKTDLEAFCKMVDLFLEKGFNYFDTAHGYMGGISEQVIGQCLSARYPRDRFILTNKLSDSYFQCEEDIRPLFQLQLDACGVEYFDFYLMHAQDHNNFVKYKACRAYETALELKNEGKIRHFGISFHDKAEVLDQILTEYPQIEVVQIQFNYVDYEDASVQSKKCYEVCRKHNKPVIVMEPVKGGHLVNLPEKAQAVFSQLGGGSNSSYAIRFAASFEGIVMVLSGMSTLEMVEENTGFMQDFKPLNQQEQEAICQVRNIFNEQNLIGCTACRYCCDGCPQKIDIPALFACMNAKNTFQTWNATFYYQDIHTSGSSKASDCIGCGACEEICPQHLPIRKLLQDVAKEFE